MGRCCGCRCSMLHQHIRVSCVVSIWRVVDALQTQSHCCCCCSLLALQWVLVLAMRMCHPLFLEPGRHTAVHAVGCARMHSTCAHMMLPVSCMRPRPGSLCSSPSQFLTSSCTCSLAACVHYSPACHSLSDSVGACVCAGYAAGWRRRCCQQCGIDASTTGSNSCSTTPSS